MKQFIKSLISSDINIANNKIPSDSNKKDNNKTNNNVNNEFIPSKILE